MSTDPSRGSSAENPDSAASPDTAAADATGPVRDAQAGAPSGPSAERSADGQAWGSSPQNGSQAAPHGGSQASSQGGGQSQGWSQAAQQPQWGQQAQPGGDDRYAQGSANGQQPQYGQRDQACSTGQAPQYGQGTYDAQASQYGQQPGMGQPYPQNGPYAQADQNGQQAQGHQYPQQYQQGGPSYAPGGYGAAPKPKSGMKKTGAVFAIVGGIILVLSLVGGLLLLGSSVSEAMEQQEQGTEIQGSGTAQLETDHSYTVYRKESAPAPSCQISGPGSVNTGSGQSDDPGYTDSDGEEWVPVDTIEVTQAGKYRVVCDSSDSILIVQPLSAGTLLNAGFAMLILLGGGSLGFILLVLGLILFFVGRSRQRAMMQQAW